jgi:hypothetical protein
VHHVRVPPSRKEDGRTTGWRRALTRAYGLLEGLINGKNVRKFSSERPPVVIRESAGPPR